MQPRALMRRMLWLAKGAAIFWGAVLTISLVLGAGTVALAACQETLSNWADQHHK